MRSFALRPVPARRGLPRPSRNAGAWRGSLASYRVQQVVSRLSAEMERKTEQVRADDLATNDWAASSAINAITTNAVGSGLRPQSKINHRRLGVSPEAASELQTNIEEVWQAWTAQADARNLLHFEDLQFLGLRTLLRQGELLHLPVARADKTLFSPLSLAVQPLSPSRLLTPQDKQMDSNIIDGVECSSIGAPVAYWIACPGRAADSDFFDLHSLPSSSFARVPARVGHRPGCFHLFRHLTEEQYRGTSVFGPGMNLFRHLSDSLDNELLAQVVTSSLAVFIERDTSGPELPGYVQTTQEDGEDRYYQTIDPGTVMYGNRNEKPHMLETARPSANFEKFCRFVLRAMAASVDMPYEVLAKDYSQTNYSSARAALLEAWKVFTLYRNWLQTHYCQPLFAMVIEEAWLRGLITLPAGAPDFYDAPQLYTRALWIGPARGYVDPVKEVVSVCKELDYHLKTRSEAIAERGRDIESVYDEIAEERELENRLGLDAQAAGQAPQGQNNAK